MALFKLSQGSLCNGQNQFTLTSEDYVNQIFDEYCTANTFKSILKLFGNLCQTSGIAAEKSHLVYNLLKLNIKSWKAQNVWSKLDKKMSGWEYDNGRACINTKVLVIGCGPCGLRVAIEAALLGCKVVLLEKRDGFTRNNVLHLWPFLIHDLKSLGAKHFFGRFCSGSIDHISIRTLQCILLKVALILGVEVHAGVEFVAVAEPHDSNEGWLAHVIPSNHPISQFSFDVCISADGKRNTMPEFKRKEFRGKLAIAVTANFINHKTKAEASVEEISGVSYIFNQKFFKDLSQESGIDLENIVYYKDETHYFVMTAKKQNLLFKKVLLQDFDDPEMLLGSNNVDQQALMSYAIKAVEFSTNYKLSNLEFAHNQYGQPDVSMFDFTSMFAAENACRIVERHNHKLLLGLVGDTLLEPFWPTGSGCARGFLSAMDAAWMIRSWSLQKTDIFHIIAERESIYQLLSQTTPENLNKNYSSHSIDPSTRYMNLNLQSIHPQQVRHLFDGTHAEGAINITKITFMNKFKQYDMCEKYKLMRWCQLQLESYENLVKVVDMYSSWKNGIALTALIHRYRPDIIDVFSLDSRMALQNIHKAIEILEREFGIVAGFAAEDILTSGIQVENLLTSYLMQFRDVVSNNSAFTKTFIKDALLSSSQCKVISNCDEQSLCQPESCGRDLFIDNSNLSTLTDKTVSEIAQNFSLKHCDKPTCADNLTSSTCCACGGRVYLVQRLIAEGFVFHRNCFKCSYCLTSLHKDYYAHSRKENVFYCKHHYGLKRPNSPLLKTPSKESAKMRNCSSKRGTISERAEYTTESEIGENEDDQTKHNLINIHSTSRLETDFSTSEEELQFLVDDMSEEEPDFTWAHVAKLCSAQFDDKIQIDSVKFSKGTFDILKDKVKTTSIVSLDSTSEADTVGGSDADWETDTEIELEDNFNGNVEKVVMQEHKPAAAILSNKMAFFSAPAQPVRIDARAFLGLDKKDRETGLPQMNESGEIKIIGRDTEKAVSIVTLEQIQDSKKNKGKIKSKLKSKRFTKKRKKEERMKKRSEMWDGSQGCAGSVGWSSIENNVECSYIEEVFSLPSHVTLKTVKCNEGELYNDQDKLSNHDSNDQTQKLFDICGILEKLSEPSYSTILNVQSETLVTKIGLQTSQQGSCHLLPGSPEVVSNAEFKKYAEISVVGNVFMETEEASDDFSIPVEIGASENNESNQKNLCSSASSRNTPNINDFKTINDENQRIPFRSTSYDSCFKLATAIDSLLQNNYCNTKIDLTDTLSGVQNICKNSNAEFALDGRNTVSSLEEISLNNEDLKHGELEIKNNLSTNSITSSKSLLSPSKFSDAKRKFFCEPPQPVRIDHKIFFGELTNEREILTNSKIMLTSGESMAICGNSNGNSKFKNLSGNDKNNVLTSKDYFRAYDLKEIDKTSEHDWKCKTEKSEPPYSPFDSSEEIKMFCSDQQGMITTDVKENYFSDPETSYKPQNDPSIQSSVELRNKDKNSEGKDKRRSFLSKIIQLKHEKKDKSLASLSSIANQDECMRTEKKLLTEKTNSLPLDKRKHGKKKLFERGIPVKLGSSVNKNERTGHSVYEEMAPIMEGIKKVQQRNRERNNIKERVRVIAPPPPKTPTANLIPPKADLDDFETESELGEERLSLWSLHSQNEKLMNISEEENSKQRKKQLKIIRRKHKEKELSRMHAVQEIIRKLEEIEIQQQQVEERGVQIERILRGGRTEQERVLDEVFLIQEWFNAIQEKNFLNRHESELIVQTRELELEDKQCQLQLQLQEIMLQDDLLVRSKEWEQDILQELVDVVEKRDKLVLLLEEERLKHKQYDRNLQRIMEERGFLLSTSASQENSFS